MHVRISTGVLKVEGIGATIYLCEFRVGNNALFYLAYETFFKDSNAFGKGDVSLHVVALLSLWRRRI